MFEKVSKFHPDKVADRIAGAITDLAYTLNEKPKVATEVLIGHGICNIIIESNVSFKKADIKKIINRIAGENIKLNLVQVKQDEILAGNQNEIYKCGDNGIFRGVPTSKEEKLLVEIGRTLDEHFPYDGKYVLDLNNKKLIVCQSNASEDDVLIVLHNILNDDFEIIVNPLGYWTGGIEVDSGATNRKLGSDMGRAVTGGGLHGKDISKADTTINLYCHILAQRYKKEVEAYCGIGDENITIKIKNKFFKDHIIYENYNDLCNRVLQYIKKNGGFEKLAEYGLL